MDELEKLMKEFVEIYRGFVNIECTLGALKRAEEQSEDYVELQKQHIWEMAGALELVRSNHESFTTRLSDLGEGLDKELKKLLPDYTTQFL